MASETIVRPAKAIERCELQALQRRASLASDEHREALVVHPDAIRLAAEQIARGFVHVAERNGKVVGFVIVVPLAVGAAEIDGLFVEPEAWRSGVGTRLMIEAERLASAEGAEFLQVIASRNARGFYAACGFDVVGKAQIRFGPALSMRKCLSGSKFRA